MATQFGSLTIPPAGSLNRVGTPADARQLAAAGARSVVPLVYGSDRIGAQILNVLPASAGSTTLLVQCLWCHACDSVNDLLLNGAALPSGASATHYTGSQTVAHAALVTAFAAISITYTDTLEGYAYSVISMPMAAFDGALDFSARIRGRKVYDRRRDPAFGGSGSQTLADPTTWEWSDNPFLCLADFVASPVYGAGLPVMWSSSDTLNVSVNANGADTLIGSPSEKRAILNGVSFINPQSVSEVIEALRSYAMGCWLIPRSNGIGFWPDLDPTPVAHYSHNFGSGDFAAFEPVLMDDAGNSPTVVEVVYTDTSQVPWRDAIASAQLLGVGSTLPVRLSQVRMPGIHRHSQAYREAYKRLVKLTTGKLAAGVELFDIGLQHEPGDVVEITHPVGFTTEPFRVLGVQMPGPGRWRLALRQHVSAAYIDDVPTVPVQPVLPRRLGDDMRNLLLEDVHDFASLNVNGALGNQLMRTWAITPQADCTLVFSASITAARVEVSSGYNLFYQIEVAGGSVLATVPVTSRSLEAPPGQRFAVEAVVAATGGVALLVKIFASVYLGAPTPMVLYESRMATLLIVK